MHVEESFEESSESLDSELVLSLHELGDSSSSTASLAVRFPCVGENWINQLSLVSTYLINDEYDPSMASNRLKKLIMTLFHSFRLAQTKLVYEI